MAHPRITVVVGALPHEEELRHRQSHEEDEHHVEASNAYGVVFMVDDTLHLSASLSLNDDRSDQLNQSKVVHDANEERLHHEDHSERRPRILVVVLLKLFGSIEPVGRFAHREVTGSLQCTCGVLDVRVSGSERLHRSWRKEEEDEEGGQHVRWCWGAVVEMSLPVLSAVVSLG